MYFQLWQNMIKVVNDISQGGTYNEAQSLVIKLSQKALYDKSTHVNKPITSSQDTQS